MINMADDNRALTYAEMREQNLFTDSVVKSSSGREWDVHKVVMSRAGSYFFTAFTFPGFTGTLDLGVCDDVVQVIIDWAYEGMCRVDVENVLEVLSAAFMYQMESLIEICVTFVLSNTISSEHIFDLKVFLRTHQVVLETFIDGDLIQTVNKFIRHVLPRFPRDIVLVTGGIIDSDVVEIFNIRKNEWKLTEITGISPDVILNNIFYEFKFPYSGWIKVRSFDIKSGHSVTEKLCELPHDLELECFEALAWNEGIVAFMGNNNAAYYNPRENSWAPFPAKKGSRNVFNLDGAQSVNLDGTKTVVVDGNIFSIGGYDEDEEGEGISRNIRYYDDQGMSWILCGYLKEKPKSLRLAVVDGKVYVVSMTEQYAECFQPILEDGRMRLIWFPNIQLPWKYETVEISVVDNNLLFNGGVQVDKKHENYGQRECNIFSPRNGEWSRVADLHGKRVGHKAFTVITSELDVDRIHELSCGQLVVSPVS